MKRTRFILAIMIFIIGVLAITTPCYATNEEVAIVKQEDSKYIIYIKGYLNESFKFAFSNDKGADVDTLTFDNSALDAADDKANSIAYVDDTNITFFANPTYMWIKVQGEMKVSALEIDINDNITKDNLEKAGAISRNIPIELEQEEIVNEVNEEGTKITETIGVVKVQKEMAESKYQLVERKSSEENDNLFALAELLEKNEFTDTYTKIKASKDFMELYNNQYNNLKQEDWKTIENSTINQPVEAQNGEQYILWIKGENIQDIHFLTSYRAYDEEYVKEEITTKLPHTYDNNTILIVLGVVVVAIILVSIRIAILKKKEMSK